MNRRKSRYEEILIRIVPQYARTEEEPLAVKTAQVATAEVTDNLVLRLLMWGKTFFEGEDLKDTQSYDAYIYTGLTLPGLEDSKGEASDCAEEISELRLAGQGRIIVHWEHYHKYLRTFIRGEKAAYKRFWGVAESKRQQDIQAVAIRNQLFEIPTPALQALFDGEADISPRPLRMWLHCTPAELADLPWELLTCKLREKEKSKFSFVRGLPPAPVPKVPVEGKLRLAFIYQPEKTPGALIKAIDSLQSVLDVVKMTEPPKLALKRAAQEGFELVHLVTDGALSLGHDGLLYLRESSPEDSPSASSSQLLNRLYRIALNNASLFKYLVKEQQLLDWNNRLIDKLDMETCSAEELSAVLRGSRVTLLSFSTPKTDDTDPGRFDGTLLPTVYSAFASLGSYTLLPSVVAPLGACDAATLENFWSSFYSHLVKPVRETARGLSPSFSLEEAMAVGIEAAPTALMALFLRQRLGREFTNRIVKIGDDDEEPARVNAKLQVERTLIEQLRAIDSNYMDIESKISDTPLFQAETERQTRLEQEIDSLAQLEADE